MNKKLYSSKNPYKQVSFNLSEEKIRVFKESPSSGSFDFDIEHEAGKKNNLRAHDLFSIFTADIIKKEVLFTR